MADTHDTLITPERDLALERMSVVDLADLLLLVLTRRRASGLVVEPSTDDVGAVRFELGGALTTVAMLDSAHSDALAARFAILARIPLGQAGEQIGRLKVRAGSDEADLLVAVRTTVRGLVGELRRIVGPADTVGAAPADVQPEEEVNGALRSVGPYRVLEEIGRGGMGIVYRAQHQVLEKEVALKLLNPGLASVPEFAARFVLEARAACRARHPGIVDVTDFGWLKNGRAYLVMELVEGETLQAVIRRGPLPLARAVRVATQIAAALEAAAARGVVHRDLKPANIFIGPGGDAKLGDFGVATIMGGDADDARIVGTAHYMAPEQAAGALADVRSDIYALGCVLFEMLTGRPPFDGAALSEVLEKQAHAAIPVLVGPDGPLPEGVSVVVRRSLAKRPDERYQSPGAFAADLERIARASGWRQWWTG